MTEVPMPDSIRALPLDPVRPVTDAERGWARFLDELVAAGLVGRREVVERGEDGRLRVGLAIVPARRKGGCRR